MHMFANLLPKLGVAALVLALLGADSGAPFRQPAIGAAAAAFEGESATDQPPSVETRPTDLTERERAEALCLTVGSLLEPHSRAIALAAARHNRLHNTPDKALADILTAVLVAENSGSALWRMPGMLDAIYPFWDGLQVASNSIGLDYSVGIGRIRPQTALELRQGGIEHQGRLIYHNVRVSLPAEGRGSQGVSSARLADDEVSIEYLAANFEMGTAAAHAFAVEPTLLDLARWHNSGIGPWGWKRAQRNEALWEKGSLYLRRVEDATKTLAAINGLPGCAAFRGVNANSGEDVS